MGKKIIFLFSLLSVIIIAIAASVFFYLQNNNSSSQKYKVDSLINGYTLSLENPQVLEQIATERKLFTEGAISPTKNEFVPISKISVTLTSSELTKIKSVDGVSQKVLSSGDYSINNGSLDIKIYVNSEFLNADNVNVANYYFTRKLLEFLVAVSPKTNATGDDRGFSGQSYLLLTQDKTLKEIDALEKQLFGEKLIEASNKPIVIKKN